MNTKIRTKILAIVLSLIIATIISIVISWVVLQVFTKQPEEILNITMFKVFSIFSMTEGIQIFVLTLLCFVLLIAVSVFRVFNLDDYLSKTYPVTKEIRIPVPVGKNQYQQGSSWWLQKKEFPNVFGVNTFDPTNHTMKHLLDFAEKERKREGYLMEHQDEIIPGEEQVTETVDPVFKKGRISSREEG